MNRPVMAQDFNPLALSSPRIFLIRMIVFVTLGALIAIVLYKQILAAFNQNPGLNTVIIGMLLIGIVFAFRHVLRLYPEIAWVNGLRGAEPASHRPPVLLAPLRSIVGDRIGRTVSAPTAIPSQTMQAILESVATRLDEARDVSRYMTGLLIFLGLLGTFWGLVETVTSVGRVIEGLKIGGDAGSVFDALKDGLAAPLGGMGVSFSSSLFGLAGSLILGFLDLQSGQAQNRFYTELQDLIATDLRDLVAPDRSTGVTAAPVSGDLRVAIEKLREAIVENGSTKTASAMANLALAIDGLLNQMRADQKTMREWVSAQGEQQRDIHRLLETVVHENARE
jgi:hypothetical protein